MTGASLRRGSSVKGGTHCRDIAKRTELIEEGVVIGGISLRRRNSVKGGYRNDG